MEEASENFFKTAPVIEKKNRMDPSHRSSIKSNGYMTSEDASINTQTLKVMFEENE